MASKITINLDTSKENYLAAKCKQNDDLTLEASIFENGEALNLTNKVVTIQGLKADKTYIIQNTSITKENNKIVAELEKDFTRVAGKTLIEVVLAESSKQNTTFSFYVEVVGSVIRGAVESSNTVTILEALENKIVEAGAVKEETEQLITSGGAATKGDIQAVNTQLEQINVYKPNYKIIAHRGFNCIAPENTLVSIQKCKDYGIKVAEFDVQLSFETNKFVIMHDETVDRTTNGTGTIISKSVAELKNLIIDNGTNIAEYDNLKIPTLEEALACCKNNNIIPDLHISIYNEDRKNEMLEVVNLLKKYDLEKKCIITFMVKNMVDYWRSISSSTVLFIPPTLDYSYVDYMFTLGNCIVGASAVDLTDAYIQYVKSKGLSLMAYTVNVVNQAQDLINKGVDAIITDNIAEGVL